MLRMDDATEAAVARGESLSPAWKDGELARITAEVHEDVASLAALHDPDNISAGYFSPEPSGVGSASVNKSIGSSWQTRVADMDAAAQLLVDAELGGQNMNVSLGFADA